MTNKQIATLKLPINLDLADRLNSLKEVFTVEVVDINLNGEFVTVKLYEKEENITEKNLGVNFVNEFEAKIKKEVEADLELLKEAVEKIGIVRTFEVVEKVLESLLDNEDFFKHFLNETVNRI